MTDAALRLAWALPLVLAIGGLAVLMLKRLLLPGAAVRTSTQRLSVRESLSVSDATRVHLIDVDGTSYIIVESTSHTSVQGVLQSLPAAASTRRGLAGRAGPAWVQRLYEARQR